MLEVSSLPWAIDSKHVDKLMWQHLGSVSKAQQTVDIRLVTIIFIENDSAKQKGNDCVQIAKVVTVH